MAQTAEQVKAKLDQAVASGATSQANATKAYNTWLSQNNTAQPKPATQPMAQPQGLNTDQQQRLEQVKASPVYQDIINKWLTDEQITKAVQWYSEDKTQSLPQADTKKTNEMTPQSFYLDDWEERQQTIISNLNAATINNPNSLKDQKTFRDFYNYDGRSDLQKKTLDTWFSWYQKWQDLSYKSANDIYSAYDTNNITISDLNNLKLANPAKYEEVNALIDKKTKLATYSQDLYWITETVNPFQSIIDNYTKWLQTLSASNFYNDYKEAMNSAGIKEQKLAIADKTTEIEKLDKEINEKKREVEKRYEWTGATRGKINAIIADELESLYSMRSNLTIDINWAINKYNAEAGGIKEDFEMKQAEQQFNMQQRQQQMSELWFAMQLMSYETPKQQDERAWNNFIRQQEYVDGNIYSTDPKTRQRAVEKAVDRVLSEFQWIPMVRSREQMVSDIQRMVESGSDLGDAITENIRKPIMNKPEYKKIMNDKYGIKYDQNIVEIAWKTYIQTTDANGKISFKQFADEWASVKTGDYKYSKIDLGNWQVVGTGQTVNFNGTDYKITQLWWSMTGWIDLYSSNRVIGAFEWWTVVGQWVDKAIDWYAPNRYIEILWDNGYVYRYNHLKEAGDWYQSYAIWTKVAQWQQIWIMWNTGKVRSASGWDWTHLDLAVYSGDRATNKSVSPLPITEQTRVLFGAWWQPTSISWTSWWSIYNSLDNIDRWFVDAMVNYQVELPSRASKNYKELMAAAVEKDPTFKASVYNERKKFQEQWNTTTIKGWSLSKAATTVQLTQQLEEIYKSLDWQTRMQALNAFVNEANRQIGNPAITNFDVARDLVVREMAGAFKGTASPTEQDVKDMSKILAGKLTPEQTQWAINLALWGIFKRINSEALSYENVMSKKPQSIFDAETYKRMEQKNLPVQEYFQPPRWYEEQPQIDPNIYFWHITNNQWAWSILEQYNISLSNYK